MNDSYWECPSRSPRSGSVSPLGGFTGTADIPNPFLLLTPWLHLRESWISMSLGWSVVVQIRPELITFLFPPSLCVGLMVSLECCCQTAGSCGYANNHGRGEGRKREIWTGGTGQRGKYFQRFHNNQSVSVSGFRCGWVVWKRSPGPPEWWPWSSSLGMLHLFVIPLFSYEMKRWDHTSARTPWTPSPLGRHQPSAGAIKTLLLTDSSPKPCGYLHTLRSILIK